ncbi:TetR/AcrR family transcriptional regulator [Auritidibacter ignavus]|uniref:TetR/AcrR family transcriptional regulator n=1 Tax=Auritidibacter ignavus TaxID=678932 RepID=UPI000D73714F|nr:TetR/AcrR family transcriptional regulator [Auritidibacter ignavus]NIH72429.1 AcrR family transcriptional regulator [Auritidibacter ignavus]PXA80519.1 TetR family transcriptional regulator [Auritidibacter sp. NML120779]RMX23418.1 TetR/AcrR family transcriptional regulator [Auritidibacter ignavus]WGH90237.1 TetR/AcrR family transcriptional regulator [Auritidibacter ignavus]
MQLTDSAETTAKERILQAALELFAQHGPAATSMRSISTQAGVTVGLITHHYGTKALLKEAVEDEIVFGIRDAIAYEHLPEDRKPDDPQAVAPTLDQRLRDWCQENPHGVNYLRHVMLLGDREVSDDLYQRITDLATAQIQELRERGFASTTRDTSEQVMRVLYGQLGQVFMQPFIDRVAEKLNVNADEMGLHMRVVADPTY